LSPRRDPHRDPVGTQVADSFLGADLDEALAGLPPDDWETIQVLMTLQPVSGDPDHYQWALETLSESNQLTLQALLSRHQLNPKSRARLLSYLGDQAATDSGRCLWCWRLLEQPTRGRPKLYCNATHRQKMHRARK
jgi:hypothetical protein